MKPTRFEKLLACCSCGLPALRPLFLASVLVSIAVTHQVGAQTLQPPPPRNPPGLPPNSQHASPGASSSPYTPQVTPSLSQTTWTPIGPASLSGGGGNYSGRITGIAVDPTNSSNIYIAAAGGGVWQTTNGGPAWVPLTDNQPTLAMGAIAIAPSNHLKIYAGTGEANNSED